MRFANLVNSKGSASNLNNSSEVVEYFFQVSQKSNWMLLLYDFYAKQRGTTGRT
jgi:hypothetical protein